MGTGHDARSVTLTLSGTTADTVTLDQLWPQLQITNSDATNTLWVRVGSTTTPTDAVASGAGCIPVLPSSTRVLQSVPIQTDAGAGTIVLSVVGNGGSYTVTGINSGIGNITQLDARYQSIGTAVLKDTVFVNVKDHGVTGTSAVDSAPAMQALVDLYGSARVTFIFPVDNYRFDTAITCPYDTQTWLCWGSVFLINHNGVGITFGVTAVAHNRPVMLGGRIRHAVAGVAAVDWTSGSIALLVMNCNYAVVRDVSIHGFETGVELRGSGGKGTQYANCYFPDILSCKFQVKFIATGASSWCNENTVKAGSCSYVTTDPNAAGGYCVYLDAINSASTAEVNNNKVTASLENPTVVNGNPAGAIYNNGRYNSFRDCRYEGFSSPFIVEGSAALQNLYDFGRGLTDPSVATLNATGGSEVRGLVGGTKYPTTQFSTPAAPATTVSTTAVMAGLGVTYTPKWSGKLRVIITGIVGSQTAVVAVTFGGKWGTGSAPTNGAAVSGTSFAQGSIVIKEVSTSAGVGIPFVCTEKITGLTLGTAVWVDLFYLTSNASDAAYLQNITVDIQEVG